MAEEKNYTAILDAIHWNDHTNPEVKWRSPAKYRNEMRRKRDKEGPLDGKEIGSTTRLIVQVNDRNYGGGVIGYMLCAVVDIDDSAVGTFYWGYHTTFIVQVLEVSNEKLASHLGHLIAVQENSYHAGRRIVEVGKANWHKYIVNDTGAR